METAPKGVGAVVEASVEVEASVDVETPVAVAEASDMRVEVSEAVEATEVADMATLPVEAGLVEETLDGEVSLLKPH